MSTVILSGIKRSSAGWKIVRGMTDGISICVTSNLLDTGDRMGRRPGGLSPRRGDRFPRTIELSEQPLLAD